MPCPAPTCVISGSSRLTRPAHADGHEAGIAPARGAPDNQQERERELEEAAGDQERDPGAGGGGEIGDLEQVADDPEQPGRARQRVDGQHVVVPLTAAGQEVPPRRRCHVPPRVGCALGATEVQSSRENPDLVYTQINAVWRTAGTIADLDHAHRIADATERPFGTDANDQTARSEEHTSE